MTREEQRIRDAAFAYLSSNHSLENKHTFAALITAVMDLPLNQWPEGACDHRPIGTSKKLTLEVLKPLISGHYTISPKPKEGDAAYPDKIVSLETGEKKLP